MSESAFVLVDAILLISNHAISEYLPMVYHSHLPPSPFFIIIVTAVPMFQVLAAARSLMPRCGFDWQPRWIYLPAS